MLAGGVVGHPRERFALQLLPHGALRFYWHFPTPLVERSPTALPTPQSDTRPWRYHPKCAGCISWPAGKVAAPSAAAAACPSPLLGRPSPHDLCNSEVGSVQCTSRACWLVKSPSSLGCTPFPIRRCPCSSPHPTCLCRQHAGRQPSERSFWEAWSPLLDAHTTEEALFWVGALEAARPGSSSVECYFGAWGCSPRGSQVHAVVQPALSCRWLWVHSAAWDASIMACQQQLKRCRA